MLILPAGHAYDYKITCKSVVMLDDVSEMRLCTVSEFAEFLQLQIKRTTLYEMRERKVTMRNQGEIREMQIQIQIEKERGREKLTEKEKERGKRQERERERERERNQLTDRD